MLTPGILAAMMVQMKSARVGPVPQPAISRELLKLDRGIGPRWAVATGRK